MAENKPKGFINIHEIPMCIDCKHRLFEGYDGQDPMHVCTAVHPPIEVDMFNNTCDEFEEL